MLIHILAAAATAAATLPDVDTCRDVATNPATALDYATGVQAVVYGYPIVDLIGQEHNETHRVSPTQPVAAPVNRIGIYPGLLTPSTQGQLRGANVDTLYLNGWFDLSNGPVLFDVPEMGQRYYTLAFMDLYGAPHHVGTRSNGGKAMRYALVGPGGGLVPEGYQAVSLPTDTIWMLGRILVQGASDEPTAIGIARSIKVTAPAGAEATAAEPMRPFASLDYYRLLNGALGKLKPVAGEEALMAQFDRAGFGPTAHFDSATLPPARAAALGCALRLTPDAIRRAPPSLTRTAHGWIVPSRKSAYPGNDYLTRAMFAQGGYINEPAESIYPSAITDSAGQPLKGQHRYRIHFAKGALPPVDAFWSITAYDAVTRLIVDNAIKRYSIGDRTRGLRFNPDGSLDIELASARPAKGASNWLPLPAGPAMIVSRLYLPRPEALDGRYDLPPIERID